jgi:hypothetical protein
MNEVNLTTSANNWTNNEEDHETVLIISMSTIALILSPITVFSNILVIIPFCRFTRVRTASNQILLALAISDLILGVLLFLFMIIGLTRLAKLGDVNILVHISYIVAMALTTMQTVSLLLMVANSGDKALSLARPLHYSEMVTFTSVNAYISIAIFVALIIGVLLPVTALHVMSTSTVVSKTVASRLVVPFGGPPDKAMQISLMVFLTLPCGLLVSVCHMYVYSVASRHAKAIRREGSVRDRMRTTSYKLTTTADNAAVVLESQHNLTIPQLTPRSTQGSLLL